MKARHVKLLHLLNDREGEYLSGKALAENLGVSKRTIREDVRFVNEHHLKGSLIVSSTRNGYKLQGIIDEIKESLYLEFVERAAYVSKRLMEQDSWVSSEELAEQLQVSTQTVNADIQRIICSITDQTQITLQTRPFLGVRLCGSESSKRSWFISLIKDEYASKDETISGLTAFFEGWLTKSDLTQIVQQMDEILTSRHIQLDIKRWARLVVVLTTIFHRQTQFPITQFEQATHLADEDQLADALLILLGVNNHDERSWLSLHLNGLKIYSNPMSWKKRDHQIKLSLCLRESLEQLGQQYGYPLLIDTQLIEGLQQHLGKAYDSLRHHVDVYNNLLPQIKEQFIQAYQMAVVLAKSLSHSLSFSIPEEEVGYLALHLQTAIDRMNAEPVQAAIVHNGTNIMATLMRQKLEQSILNLSIEGIYRLEKIGRIPENVKVIISTKPIALTQKHILMTEELLRTSDINRLKAGLHFGELRERVSLHNFFLTDEHSKKRLLEEFVKQANVQTYLSSIQDRESLSTTEVGNKIAIPHPLVSADVPRSEIYVCVNKRCIHWGTRSVQIVFLLLLSEKDTIFYESIFREIYQFMRSEKGITHLLQGKSYQSFIESLNM
ncbi:BglG family transcription antiterminator [Alkalicoccobacillus gibsonii]|uniref:BglG family transcription antiterminator n=1 Tax=Alkalicoccobacillus gibsonii TaxID=79881 RepID=UPI00193286CE|nr:HTH domain-containing protein [Alkalicoccobacillus gibsonii]MBM0065940.1 HTH domain-containing protein [Alkalicoccobacillus gibsonii]